MNARLKEQTDLYTYNGSRYATRNVIGTVEVLESFTPIELKAYYHDYYRPDLQAVIVIGDVEPARIEREIHRLFDPFRNGSIRSRGRFLKYRITGTFVRESFR